MFLKGVIYENTICKNKKLKNIFLVLTFILTISTWIWLEVGLIGDAFSNGIGKEVDAFGVFLQTIPYRFYNILIWGFVLLTTITLREFEPMRKVEIKSRNSIKNNKKVNNLIEKENSDIASKYEDDAI